MSSQSNGFGPWSTSLDNGTRMQLSAFWRQRMAGLARLPIGRRLSRRWAACGIMATLLLAAMPLVELSSGAVAEENPSAAKDAKPKAGDEFVWRFSNGLEVELIGLAKNPSKDEAWWRPDGAPLSNASLPQARYRSSGGEIRELAFRWRNVSDNPADQTRLWHTQPPYDGAGGGVSEEDDSSILEVTGVTFASGLKATTVTFTASVSSTPWKKSFETDGRHASSAGRFVDGKPLSAAFTTAHETRTGIAITASYGLGNQSGRLVLFDKSGKELLPTRQNGVGSTHFTQTTFEFDGVALADVERFELQTQTRTLETVEFRNVSLQPGHATKVVIEPYEVDRAGVETSYLPIEARVAIEEAEEKRIDRLPILGPITSGKEIVFLDPPSDEEILNVFNKSAGPSFLQQIGLTKKKELPLDQIAKIEKIKFEEKVDPPRQYPMIGQARQVHTLYMCELQLRDGKTHKLCVDHNHLHMTSSESKEKSRTATSAAGSVAAAEAESMSLEEALKIVHPAKGARVEVSQEVERQASNRVAREERKLLLELVESGAFTLKPGELVKFVPASESGEARRKLALLRGNRPHFFFFQPPAGGFPRLPGGKYDEMSLMDVIEDVIGLPIQHVEGSDQTLGQELPEGDWICYWDRSQTQQRAPLDRQLVAAFEKTLKGVLKHPVSLSLVNREMPVLFATGAYQANPIVDEKWDMPSISPEAAKTMDGPFLFPARRGDTFDKFTDFQGMTEMIGALLLTPIVDRSSPGPTKESFCMTFAEPPQVYLNEPLNEAAKQAVINAFEKQTSLKLTPGKREMAVLVVGDGKSN